MKPFLYAHRFIFFSVNKHTHMMCRHAYVHVNMSSCLQKAEKASYVIETTLTLSCISFTLLCLPLSFPSLSYSSLLAKFHTTCPWQSRFTDYHPLNASHACRWKTLLRRTRALPAMQRGAGCPCASTSCRVFSVCLSADGSSGT